MEAGLFNHCYSGKAVSILYSECMFVALGIQHAMHMHHIIMWPLQLWYIFPHLINGMTFDKGTEHKIWVLIFSTNFSGTFLILRIIERNMIKICIGLHSKYPLFLPNANKLWIFSTDFRRIFKYKISWKFVEKGAELFHVERTDGRTRRA